MELALLVLAGAAPETLLVPAVPGPMVLAVVSPKAVLVPVVAVVAPEAVLVLVVAASLVVAVAGTLVLAVVAPEAALVLVVAASLGLVVAALLAVLVPDNGTVHRTGAAEVEGAVGKCSAVAALRDGRGERSEPELTELEKGTSQNQTCRCVVSLVVLRVPGMVGGG